MKSGALVSVVMIFRDADRFLDEAVASVTAQTYPNWELLLVDDGSAEASSRQARRWAGQYPGQISYLEHPGHGNQGMSASRNLGIRHARGSFIAFLDADDVWLPAKLERQMSLLDCTPDAAMIYGRSQWWYSWSGLQEDQQRDFVHPLGVPPDTVIRPPRLLHLFYFRQSAAIPSPSSILIRRQIVDQVGGFEDAFTGLYEDQVFYAKIGLAAPVLACDSVWDRYRQHATSSTATARAARQEYAARLAFLRWLAKYLRGQQIGDPGIWRAMRHELWRCQHLTLGRLLASARQVRPAARQKSERLLRQLVPSPVRAMARARLTGQEYCPPPGWVDLGHLRRRTPISRDFGFDRGLPVDRYYIDQFLMACAGDIRGRVLEIAEDTYARRFGGSVVTQIDVLHVTGEEPKATLVGDLTDAPHIPSAAFDCIILTQTLQFIYDVPSALATIHRILRPGGVVLGTVPGITQISMYDMQRWGQFWSFTELSVQRLFASVFAQGAIRVEGYGNVLAAVGFLHGLATHELGVDALKIRDPDYPLIITVRAVKA
jgi:glycosyltransferase involved in cell wall biosynthesis/SAM-dependent methyltransferase